MSGFTGAAAEELKRRQREDEKRIAERGYAKQTGMLLGIECNPTDHDVSEIRRILADRKASEDRVTARKAEAGYARSASPATDAF